MPTPTQAGRVWVKHRYRTTKFQVPSGRKVTVNNPNPPESKTIKYRLVKKVVEQRAGETVPVYDRIPKAEDVIRTQSFRKNGPWKQVRPWSNVVFDLRSGALAAPADTETTPDPELEPLEITAVKRRIKEVKIHLEEVNVIVESRPNLLMSWDELVAARKDSSIPDPKRRVEESQYMNSRDLNLETLLEIMNFKVSERRGRWKGGLRVDWIWRY